MTQFRWTTSAIMGQWCATQGAALCDALASGQATVNEGVGAIIVLKKYATIQQRARPRHPYFAD